MRPDDANVAGNVHGGTILKMIEEAGAIISTRHCNSQSSVSVWGHSPAWKRPARSLVSRCAQGCPTVGSGRSLGGGAIPWALGPSGSSTHPALFVTPGNGVWCSAQPGRVGTKLIACQQLPLNTSPPVWKRLGFWNLPEVQPLQSHACMGSRLPWAQSLPCPTPGWQ